MKTIFLTTIILFLSISLYSQDQVVNTLTSKSNIFVGEHVNGKWGLGSILYFQGTDSSNDPIWMAKYTAIKESTDLRINIGDSKDANDRFVVGTTHWDTKEWSENFVVNSFGKVGIGVSHPTCALDVNGAIRSNQLDVAGTIRAREVKIEVTAGADHVFSTDYNLRPLSEVETFVQENKHLPDIPSEKQMQEEGLNINEMQIKLLQKIEELTLYVIELKKENDQQNELIKKLEGLK